MHDFGNIYQSAKEPLGNSSRLFWSLAGGEDRRRLWEPVKREEFDDAEARVGEVLSRLPSARMDRPDAAATGAGETSITAVAAAIGNAIFDATGVRLRQVPFTTERVRAALAARRT